MKALETQRRVLGVEHPDTMQTINNLGLLYLKVGKREPSRFFAPR
jgi:hypothetical protein